MAVEAPATRAPTTMTSYMSLRCARGAKSSFQSARVTLRRALDRGLGVAGHEPLVPRSVQALEWVWLERRDHPLDRRGGQRDEVRVAAHEADPAAILHHLHDVAREQGAAALLAVRPVQDRAAREVPAEAQQRDAGLEHAGVAVPKNEAVVGAHHPLAVGNVEVHGRIERAGVLDHRGVVVRVRDRDRGQAAALANGALDLPVEQRDAIPQHVAAGGLDEQRALLDREARLRPDPGQSGLLGAEVGAVTGAQLVEGGPALSPPADVLALVLADRA